ncbi:MAG: FapA family protein [Treponema sp.]|nr:FapA family protein [Treponema sp.]
MENEKQMAAQAAADGITIDDSYDQDSDEHDSVFAEGGTRNGKITLIVSSNHLEVRGNFLPPENGGEPITREYIASLLAKRHIRFGIQHEEVEKAYQKCTAESAAVLDVLVAQGEPAVNEIPSYLQLNPLLAEKDPEPLSDTDSVDHRKRSPFTIIKKDMALAKQKRHKPGKNGINVYGETINFHVNHPEGLEAWGENTRMEDRYVLSNINGQLVIKNKAVSVRETLIIAGPVGYGTGNIIFPGNVEIHGAVSDGFKIYSGGSVKIKQTFDVTDAVTKGDLVVSGGIIGRGRALVKVGGNLTTKFIENCSVACRKTINVDVEILNSKIFSLEKVVMKDRGRIVGAEVYALKGISVGSIGRITSKASRIVCGVDFTLEQEREKNNAALRILSGKLEHLANLMSDPNIDDEKREKIEALQERLGSEKCKAQEKISEILSTINACEDAVVEVSGEIVPGTRIEICQKVLEVTQTLRRVRIRLSQGEIVTEKL